MLGRILKEVLISERLEIAREVAIYSLEVLESSLFKDSEKEKDYEKIVTQIIDLFIQVCIDMRIINT